MPFLTGLILLWLLQSTAAMATAEFSSVFPDSVNTHLESFQGQARADEILNIARVQMGNDPSLCLIYLEEAIQYAESIHYPQGMARGYNGMGAIHNMIGNNATGLEYLQKSLKIYKKIDDLAGQAKTLQNISTMQSTLGLYEKSLATSNLTLKLRQEIGDEMEIAKSLIALAINHRDLENNSKALEFANQGVELRRKLSDSRGLAISLTSLGTIQVKLRMYEAAFTSHNEAVAIAREFGDSYHLGTTLCNLGMAYISKKDWAAAIITGQEALLVCDDIGVVILQENAHSILATAYEGMSQNDLALQHFHQAKRINDKIYSDSVTQKISVLTAQFDLAQNRNRLLVLERDHATTKLILAQEKNQRNLYLVGFSISLPLALLAFVLYRRSVFAHQKVVQSSVELQAAMEKMKLLQGLIPICASCKCVRDDKGYWHQVEAYVSDHSEAKFSHGICPQCKEIHYGDLF